MIGNLVKGRDATGLAKYLLSAVDHAGNLRERVNILGGTLAGRTAAAIAAELDAFQGLRPTLGVHLVHQMLRLADFEDELTDSTWLTIAKRWVADMGFQAWLAIAHEDQHIHIVASRVCIDGSVVSDQNDYFRSETCVRQIEREFGLVKVKPSHLLDHERKQTHQKVATKGATEIEREHGIAMPAKIIAGEIDRIFASGSTVTLQAFVADLQSCGIDVRPNLAATGKMSGFAYRMGNVKVTSSAMGRSYTWARLLARGLAYDVGADQQILRNLLTQSMSREPPEVGTTKYTGPEALQSAAVYTQARMQTLVDVVGPSQIAVGTPESRMVYRSDFVPRLMQDAAIEIEFSRRFVVLGDIPRDRREQVMGLLEPSVVISHVSGTCDVVCRVANDDHPLPTQQAYKEVAQALSHLVGAERRDSIASPVPRSKSHSRVEQLAPRLSRIGAEAQLVARHSPGALAIWAKAGVSELFHKLIAAAKRRLGLSNLTLTSASQMQKNAQPAKLANPRTDTDHEDDFSA
jgi:hypothetical protein